MLTGPDIVARILDIQPGLETVSLAALASTIDTYSSGVDWRAKRTPNDADTLLLVNAIAGQEHRTFQLLRQSQAVMPQPNFRLTDAAGVVWTIQNVKAKVVDYVFDCMCLRNR